MKKFILGFGLVIFSFYFATNDAQAFSWPNEFEEIGDVFERGFDGWLKGTTRDIVHDIFGPSQPDGRFELPISTDFNEVGRNTSMRGFILNVLNFFLSFLGIVAIAAIVYAGFLYVTSAVDDGNAEKAKNIIIYATIGILVVLVSYALVNTLIRVAPSGGDDRSGLSVPQSFVPNNNLPLVENLATGGADLNPINSPEVNLLNLPEGQTPKEKKVYENLLESTSTKIKSFFDSGPILVFVDGEQKIVDPIIVSLESAKKGIDFRLAWEDAASAWNFNNGITRVLNPGDSATVRFSQAKNYQIQVIVQTADGETVNFTKTLQVEDAQANFTVSKTTVLVNESVDFNASGSRTNIGEIVDYQWDCTGGTGCFPNYSGKSFTAKFGASGTYEIQLTIETNVGSTASKMQEITILKDKPTASFEVYDDKDEVGGFRFDAVDSENVAGQNSGLIYKWTFGDGTRQTGGPIMFHKYEAKGSYSVELTVEENRAGKILLSDMFTQSVKVNSVLDADFDFIQ